MRHPVALIVFVCATLSSYPALAQFSQQGQKLVGTGAVDFGGGVYQGWSVSLSADGNTAIVGGYDDNIAHGAAWIWTRNAGVWTQEGNKLVGSGAAGPAFQGSSVSLSADGNTAIVGGYVDNFGVGAAWIWTRSGGVWTQQGPKLVGSGALGLANQGYSVSLSADGNTAIVGGVFDNHQVGAAWIWTRSAGVWTQQGPKLVGSNAVGAAEQGWSVSLSADGNTAVVGGYADNVGAGAAWVWTRSAGVWTQQGSKLVGGNVVGSAGLGSSVSLSADGNLAIVGGYADSLGAGGAWVWTRSGGVWTQQGTKLVGSGAAGNAQQGSAVSVSADGNMAIVGGAFDDNQIGAAWIWTRSGGVWTQQGTKLVGSGAVGSAYQGYSVSLSGDGHTAIVGGYGDNNNAGAAWVFSASTSPIKTWFLPSSARAGGQGGSFYTTDLTVANRTATDASVTLKFLGHDVDGRSGVEQTVTIGAGHAAAFADILGNVFSVPSGYGAIRVSSTAASLNVLGQTSTPGPSGGTFGQSVPAMSGADLVTTQSPRSIAAVREDGSFRTNLILANATSSPLTVNVALVDGNGSQRAAGSYPLQPLGMTQVTQVVRGLGVSADLQNGQLILSTATPGGAFAAYASVVDKTTNDPRTLLPAVSGSGGTWFLPSSARSGGQGGSFYTTQLTMANRTAIDTSVTLQFLGHDADGRGGTQQVFNLAAGKAATYADVLGSVFGLSSGYGAIKVSSPAASLNVLGQTSTPGPSGGTFGQSVPASGSADLVTTGAARSIVAVREDASFRTNLILTNATEAALVVDVKLLSGAGTQLASGSYPLAPLGMTQVTQVVRGLGVTADLQNGQLVLSTATPGGAFAAYASVVDRTTNDPRTLLPR